MKGPALALVLGAALVLDLPQAPAATRADVAGTEAAVTAGHPLAVAAGADVLRRGGNAVDAAVTMAAVLAVVRPHMCGVGGDAFLLIRDGTTGRIHALNGSGRAGSRADLGRLRRQGLGRMPSHGALSVTVPGAARAWSDALERFGTRPLSDALAPAIRLAEDGFPVSRRLAADIAEERERLAADPALAAAFLHGGAPPAVGSLLRQADLASTLRALASGGADALYAGELGRAVAGLLDAEGGLVTAADLAAHRSTWPEPLETSYLGHRVFAFPPNSQGMALLEMMNLAESFDVRALGHNTPGYVDVLVALKRLAYADRDAYLADPDVVDVPAGRLISKEHAQELAPEIRSHPRSPPPARDGRGDTVYLAAVDRHGNAVSLIQSLFDSFGSGRLVPGTGIVLHNRGALFDLDPAHPNRIAPAKRPFHTLSPALALRPDGSLAMVFGTPGGDGQPQTLLQVFHNVVAFGMTPQQAVEAPRFRHMADGSLVVEDGVSGETRRGLEAAGHRLARPASAAELGGAQVILRYPASDALWAGADPRREAYALAW